MLVWVRVPSSVQNLIKMKAYGLNKKFRFNYPDNHPPKGWVNWWETEMGSVNKGRARQEAKRNLRKEINGEND